MQHIKKTVCSYYVNEYIFYFLSQSAGLTVQVTQFMLHLSVKPRYIFQLPTQKFRVIPKRACVVPSKHGQLFVNTRFMDIRIEREASTTFDDNDSEYSVKFPGFSIRSSKTPCK